VPVSASFTSMVSPTPELPAWTSLLLGLGMTAGLLWRGRWKIARNMVLARA
jgi:hypothetical protein